MLAHTIQMLFLCIECDNVNEQTESNSESLHPGYNKPITRSFFRANATPVSTVRSHHSQPKKASAPAPLPTKNHENIVNTMEMLNNNGTPAHVVKEMDVPSLVGKSRLKVLPNYLPKQICDELTMNILNCQELRQYNRKHHPEPRLHILLHKQASPIGSPEGVGYVYHDVKMQAVPFSTVEGIEQIADELAAKLGVSQWSIGVEIIAYASGDDGIGWHSDVSQGETEIACIILQTTADPRPVLFRRTGKAAKPIIELKLGQGSVYSMNGEMQRYYQHKVPKMNRIRPISAEDRRIVLICRQGNTVVTSDNGVRATLDSRMTNNKRPLIIGPMDSIVEGNLYHPDMLEVLGAHRNSKRGVDGSLELGCGSIVMSRNCPLHEEHDGE